MATNPVPQRNHPSNAEEQENLEKPTLAHLAKQTHTGQILHVPDSDFLNVVDDKILGNQIIQALGNSEFCKNAKPDKPDETFVLKKLKQHVGYGFVISEIMRKKGVPLRKPKNVASFKYLFRNPKTLRRRKPTEASTTSRDTVGSNAPKKKRGRPTKRTSRISEGLGSNEAPLVVMESANDEIVTSNLIETAIVPVMPTGDHQPYPPSLPTEFTNNEALISPLQIEGLDSQLEANILEKGSEPFF
nr:hypothetical protein Iba_scaffold5439CG0010 [Ipomoea batatas]